MKDGFWSVLLNQVCGQLWVGGCVGERELIIFIERRGMVYIDLGGVCFKVSIVKIYRYVHSLREGG